MRELATRELILMRFACDKDVYFIDDENYLAWVWETLFVGFASVFCDGNNDERIAADNDISAVVTVQ